MISTDTATAAAAATVSHLPLIPITATAVIGAGNMGSGIAQKIATEGVPVLLIDTTIEQAQKGKERIAALLQQGVERKLFSAEQAQGILGRVTPSGDVSDAANTQLVIEAVFEDLQVKRDLFARLDEACPAHTLLATNTSSFLVADIATAATRHPERVLGLHYFYHPAKNRLVEVIGHAGTRADVLHLAWQFQEQIGKTPIASADAPGFVVNRFFVPWLNEAIRLNEEGHPIHLIEQVAKQSFGVGMGPFELMNVTGVPITLHAATALADKLGAFYAPAASLKPQVDSKQNWALSAPESTSEASTAAASASSTDDAGEAIANRLWGVVAHIACALIDEKVSCREDVDIGARVGLRWPKGPFEAMNQAGMTCTNERATAVQERYTLSCPTSLTEQVVAGHPFALERVQLTVKDNIGTIRINRPDQLNALDPETVGQLGERFDEALKRDDVQGIVIAGAGKAFVAGADVKFFVDNIKAGAIQTIVDFAAEGQRLFRRIEQSPKRVVCCLDGMALGGGAELMLACHAVVATPKASVAFPETGIGIYPGLGGTQRLTRRLGKGGARALLLTGNMLGAQELAALGLVWRVVTHEVLAKTLSDAVTQAPVQAVADWDSVKSQSKLEPLAHLAGYCSELTVSPDASAPAPAPENGLAKAIKRMGHKAPLARAAVLKLTAHAAEPSADLDAGLQSETSGLADIFSSADALEGLSSTLERRRPTFTGR